MAIVYPADCDTDTESIKVLGETDSYFSRGHVGIGTDNPSESLEVYGGQHNIHLAVDSNPTLQLLNYSHDNVGICFDSYYSGGWKSSDSGSNFRIYKVSDRLHFSYANGVDPGNTISDWTQVYDNVAIVIKKDGNVGIGTTAANDQLEVSGKTRLYNDNNAALNIPVLDDDPGERQSGDIWLINDKGTYYFRAYINHTIVEVQLS